MGRKSMFNDFQLKEIKEMIRTGEPIVILAERLAPTYNVPESSMRTKLYNIAKRTYKISEWNGPKRRTRKAARIDSVQYPKSVKLNSSSKRVTIEEDHIRIYF